MMGPLGNRPGQEGQVPRPVDGPILLRVRAPKHRNNLALNERLSRKAGVKHRVACGPGVFIRKHGKPFRVDGILERFVLRPDNHLNNVVGSPSCGRHDAPHVIEHQLALSLDVVRKPSCIGLHSEDAARHHEVSDDASHGNGILVVETGNFKTATLAHCSLLDNKVKGGGAPPTVNKDNVEIKRLHQPYFVRQCSLSPISGRSDR